MRDLSFFSSSSSSSSFSSSSSSPLGRLWVGFIISIENLTSFFLLLLGFIRAGEREREEGGRKKKKNQDVCFSRRVFSRLLGDPDPSTRCNTESVFFSLSLPRMIFQTHGRWTHPLVLPPWGCRRGVGGCFFFFFSFSFILLYFDICGRESSSSSSSILSPCSTISCWLSHITPLYVYYMSASPPDGWMDGFFFFFLFFFFF